MFVEDDAYTHELRQEFNVLAVEQIHFTLKGVSDIRSRIDYKHSSHYEVAPRTFSRCPPHSVALSTVCSARAELLELSIFPGVV